MDKLQLSVHLHDNVKELWQSGIRYTSMVRQDSDSAKNHENFDQRWSIFEGKVNLRAMVSSFFSPMLSKITILGRV